MEGTFSEWFGPWKETRADGSPIGWYSRTDMETAFRMGFSAGVAHEKARVLDEIMADIRHKSDRVEGIARGDSGA